MPPERTRLIDTLTRIPHLGEHLKASHDAWLRFRIHSFWRSKGTLAQQLFEACRPVLTEAQGRVLADINNDGIASINFDNLLPDRQLWDRLLISVSDWLDSDGVK